VRASLEQANAVSITGAQFLAALFADLRPGHHAVIAVVPEIGPPGYAEAERWARAWWPGREIPRRFLRANAYVTISSFAVPADGRRSRHSQAFVALHAVMIDDVGTKVSPDAVDRLPLSALVETSPGNHQAWLFIRQDADSRDPSLARRLLARMASGLTADRTRGVIQYGRLPIGVNNKAEVGTPFRVRCIEFAPERRYSIREIAEAFQLDMTPREAHAFDEVAL